jgi:hypothetical protein
MSPDSSWGGAVKRTVARICALSGMALVLVVATAGCGRVVPSSPVGGPGDGAAPERPSASPSADEGLPPDEPPPSDAAEPFTPPALPAPTFAPPPEATTAAPCAGRPSVAQVIAALRRERNLVPAGVAPRATTGPLCAGSWQYTILDVPNHDPLQVVTRGNADALTVVTAGTYVCTPEVTGTAPAAIVSAARCR